MLGVLGPPANHPSTLKKVELRAHFAEFYGYVWWHTAAISALEAEAGGLLQVRGRHQLHNDF